MHHNVLVFDANAPRVAELRPIVGVLALEAVLYRLLEQTVFITYAIALKRQLHSGGAVEKARRKPSQAAVAQRRVFNLLKSHKVSARAVQQLLGVIVQTQAQDIVIHRASHKELHRKIRGASARRRAAAHHRHRLFHYRTGKRVMQLHRSASAAA